MDPGRTNLPKRIRDLEHRIVEETLERQRACNGGAENRFGQVGRRRSREDAHHNLLNLAEALECESPALFGAYVHWLRSVLEARGVSIEALAEHLRLLGDTIAREIPEATESLLPACIDEAERVLSSPSPSEEQTPYVTPGEGLAGRYLSAALEGDRGAAVSLVVGAVGDGLSVRDAYLTVLQPVQREVGRLWERAEISVAAEHCATAITHLVLSNLYPYIPSSHDRRGTVVITSAAGELHEVGGRMVADFFDMAGWDAYFLGASTPVDSVMDMARARKADVLGVSASTIGSLGSVRLVAEALEQQNGDRPILLVGGRVFDLVPNLWKSVDADAYAPDADAAVERCEQILSLGDSP